MRELSKEEMLSINGGMVATGIFYNYIGIFLNWYSNIIKKFR